MAGRVESSTAWLAASVPSASAWATTDARGIPSAGTVRSDAVPADAVRSELGRAVYDEEPGRFDRDRLEVVRDTYRALLRANAATMNSRSTRGSTA